MVESWLGVYLTQGAQASSERIRSTIEHPLDPGVHQCHSTPIDAQEKQRTTYAERAEAKMIRFRASASILCGFKLPPCLLTFLVLGEGGRGGGRGGEGRGGEGRGGEERGGEGRGGEGRGGEGRGGEGRGGEGRGGEGRGGEGYLKE